MHSFRSFLCIEWLVTNAVCLVDLLTLNLKDMEFRNYTPHTISLNNGTQFPSEGLARVANTFTEFVEGICEVHFGDIQGLPEPQEGVLYIVSALVLSAAKAAGRTDCVAPATGHPDCIRDAKGFILSVPGFVRQNRAFTEFSPCKIMGVL